jgi:hypothetical protein
MHVMMISVIRRRSCRDVNQMRQPICRRSVSFVLLAIFAVSSVPSRPCQAEQLLAGVAKVDVTHPSAKPINDRLYAKALVLKSGQTTAVIVTIDVVAIAEIGSIKNDFLDNVRTRIQDELGIEPTSVVVNASHCHGTVCAEIEQRTFEAVKLASQKLTPVHIGAGVGHEDRIMENRRLRLKDGREIDVRHAYSLPPDGTIVGAGPIDPQIGVLRLDKPNGETLAAVYNFACHPIQGVPSGGNSADMIGFASSVIEDNLSDGAIALFVQGCAGDINPSRYKDVDHPRDAEPLGNLLGLSALKALRTIETKQDDRLRLINQVIELPRSDTARRIASLKSEQQRLLLSLRGTHLNLKSFLPLAVKYNLSAEFPSYYSYKYLHEEAAGRSDLKRLDADNRAHIKRYTRNIHIMEELTRIQANLALLEKHQRNNLAAKKRMIDVELVGIRVGDFVMVSFPGELTVQIGLNIKKASPHDLTFVAAYSNGYIYYAPTADQLRNVGGAQEDSECILAPEWQKIFEGKAAKILSDL